MTLIQIHAAHFTAGVECNPDGRVIDCAPILSYMRGWDLDRVRDYVERKGWKLTVVVPYNSEVLHGKTKITLAGRGRQPE